MPFFESNDMVNIHYEDCGAGRPLVFVHGWAMSVRVWRFQQELAASSRFISMDLRGHGQSNAPAHGYALDDFATDVVAMFARLDLTDAVLVGWSMGVQVVLQAFPVLRPRLAGLVLVAGTPKFIADAEYPHGLPPLEVKGMGLRLKRDFQRTMGAFLEACSPRESWIRNITRESFMKSLWGGVLQSRRRQGFHCRPWPTPIYDRDCHGSTVRYSLFMVAWTIYVCLQPRATWRNSSLLPDCIYFQGVATRRS